MPAQLLTQPNPPPEKSLLPKELGALSVKLDLNVLSQEELNDVKAFRRAADYIAAGTCSSSIFIELNVDAPPVTC